MANSTKKIPSLTQILIEVPGQKFQMEFSPVDSRGIEYGSFVVGRYRAEIGWFILGRSVTSGASGSTRAVKICGRPNIPERWREKGDRIVRPGWKTRVESDSAMAALSIFLNE